MMCNCLIMCILFLANDKALTFLTDALLRVLLLNNA